MKVVLLLLLMLLVATTGHENSVQLGPRPYWLVDQMQESFLKTQLENCAARETTFEPSDFSIGHRGACLQFPEHSASSYEAAALMGAGIIECDVTFTKDLELVCRHSQCDLHTTTDVVLRPEMNAKCTTPWVNGTDPRCCTSDFTLEEIQTLCAKMDSNGPNDGEAEDYVYGGTADHRTDLYQGSESLGCDPVMTHKESIALILEHGRKFTPELKFPRVDMPFYYDGYNFTQEDYAQKMIDEYVEMGVPPDMVYPQSFYWPDIFYWIENTEFGDQAVALGGYETGSSSNETLELLLANNVKIHSPSYRNLVQIDPSSPLGISATDYAIMARSRGLNLITYTLERSSPSNSFSPFIYEVLYVLGVELGALGVFTDWPSTLTFFANCMRI